MLDILQYSTIILAGNLTVLLVISLATDYWEYRGFRKDEIVDKIRTKGKPSDLVRVPDTDSYIVINHTRYYNIETMLIQNAGKIRLKQRPTPPPTSSSAGGDTASSNGGGKPSKNKNNNINNIAPAAPSEPVYFQEYEMTIYEPPCLMKKTYFKRVPNCTVANEINRLCGDVVFLVLFEEYGNLFRDCDNLESGVRSRLNMGFSACHFVFTHDDTDTPAIQHLEVAAFVFAVLALASMLVNLSAGVYGSSVKHRALLLTASFASLGAGISYTVAIALFHAKCHLIHLREFIRTEDIPYKEVIETNRTFEFGWSFVLAWICVVLSFTSAWTWLYKSQDLRPKFITQKLKSHLIGSKITSKTLNAARAAAAEIARRNASQVLLQQFSASNGEAVSAITDGSLEQKNSDLLQTLKAASMNTVPKSGSTQFLLPNYAFAPKMNYLDNKEGKETKDEKSKNKEKEPEIMQKQGETGNSEHKKSHRSSNNNNQTSSKSGKNNGDVTTRTRSSSAGKTSKVASESVAGANKITEEISEMTPLNAV